MVAENPTPSARLIAALLARGFNLPDAVRELNLPAADLLTLARDGDFRDQLKELRSLIVELAHLNALGLLQKLSAAEPDPIEQRRICAAILRYRAEPPAAPAADCPVPAAPPAKPPRMPADDSPDRFVQDLLHILAPGPDEDDDLDDPATLEDPESTTGRALRSLHACLAAAGPDASLDGRPVPADFTDFLRELEPHQIREFTGFTAPIRTIEVDTDTRRVERLVFPHPELRECTFRRVTLIRDGPDSPWRLHTMAPYKVGPNENLD